MLQYLKDKRIRLLLLFGFLLLTYQFFLFIEGRLIFAPTSLWAVELPEGAEELTIGKELSAAWFPVPGANFVIVYCHGNAGNISHRFALARHFQQMGWPTLLFDYRGYGKSTGGPPSEEKIILDTQLATREALRLSKSDKVIFYGRSLGSVPAIRNSAKFSHQTCGLILDSPLLSAKAMAEQMGLGWLSLFITQELDNEFWIIVRSGPTLIIHGDADRIVPISHGKKLAERAFPKATLVEIPNGRHNDSRRKGLALEALKSFIEEVTKR
ncbi:MAG: hypothetical protein CBC13_10415 [Planctomycetia bacterium TMED53]|nr:MAG: hypothetical protein CBC13_10415 [Planctomycetia bacterium TMED53]